MHTDGKTPDRARPSKAATPSGGTPAADRGRAPAKAPAGSGAPAKAAPARAGVPGRLPSRAPAAPASAATGPASYKGDGAFLDQQRKALQEERGTYVEQARLLRAEAESLVQEMEPGDVQFDEESGEGGTTTVDRERDLALSAQALAAVEEIDAALEKIESGRYGICEGCGELIPKPRLEALPYARLCIACKSGGLSRR